MGRIESLNSTWNCYQIVGSRYWGSGCSVLHLSCQVDKASGWWKSDISMNELLQPEKVKWNLICLVFSFSIVKLFAGDFSLRAASFPGRGAGSPESSLKLILPGDIWVSLIQFERTWDKKKVQRLLGREIQLRTLWFDNIDVLSTLAQLPTYFSPGR